MKITYKEAFKRVSELVDRFEQNYAYYKGVKYQEAEVRKDFIDPFLIALGWDVNHEYQNNPYKQEVKVEKTQKQEGEKSKKFADYAFYLEPDFKNPIFFVEAKKPAVLLENNTLYYLQTHKYGWNAQTPLSILTDFEELIIIDCRTKPHPIYSSNTAVQKYNYTQFKDEAIFKKLYYLFSREAVVDGSISHFVETQIPKKKLKERQLKLFGGGYKAVDDDFLEYIDQLRLDLARAFHSNNPELTPKQLTEATQKTIDRLVFIRFLEDKQIEFEDYINEIKNWKSFVQLSRTFDGKYNGIVFKESIIDKQSFKGVEDGLFHDICHDISSKESPYNFNVIPVHILGSIYERFLGKVVTIENGIVTIEPKPEVRKAGGVFYTPKYIVDYIIENSVGKVVKGKTPKEIDKLSFADISCGSGSFLIGVYEYLIDYHKHYYQDKLQDKTEIDGRSEDLGNVMFNEGAWVLTLKRKQDILLNCIYGVDIDNQAVEVSQLSLFLKLLEDENFGTTTKSGQITAFSKVLPDLTQNIRSGNSLVGWDIIENDDYSIEEQKEINPFDYRSSFPKVFANGGFDALVGNPPYVKEYTNREVFEVVKKSYLKKYYQGKMDLWYFFVCNGIDLLKPKGQLGYIIPNNWTTNAGASILRNKIVDDSQIIEMIDFGSYMVFDSASIQTMVLLLEKASANKIYTLEYLKLLNSGNRIENAISLLQRNNHENNYFIKPKFDRESFKNTYILFGNKDVNAILNKIFKCKNFELDAKNEVAQGIVTPQDSVNKKSSMKLNIPIGKGIFVISIDELSEFNLDENEKNLIKPIYFSNQIEKYYTDKVNKSWIIYTDSKFQNPDSLDEFPNIKKHLDKFKDVITSSNKPYGLHRARKESFFKGEKIISLRKCSAQPTFAYANFDTYVLQSYYIIKSKRIELKYLIGILNSNLIKFWLLNKGKMQGNNYQIDKEPLLNIPIYRAPKKEDRNKVIELVDKIIETKSQRAVAATSSDEVFYDRKILNLENQINNIVYNLYGFNDDDDEIAVIETL
jgi:adenine-specific DNA-methyltransferase